MSGFDLPEPKEMAKRLERDFPLSEGDRPFEFDDDIDPDWEPKPLPPREGRP